MNSPFSYLRKRKATAARKHQAAADNKGFSSRFLHLNERQPSAGARLVAAHEAARPIRDQAREAPAISTVVTKNDHSPGHRLVAAHVRQAEAKECSGRSQLAAASPGERMLALAKRRHGS